MKNLRVSYFIKQKGLGVIEDTYGVLGYYNSLKTLKGEIKKLIDKRATFQVYVLFRVKKKWLENSIETWFEVWEYDGDIDKVYNHNLRKNKYLKRMLQVEKSLRPIMLKHNVVKKEKE